MSRKTDRELLIHYAKVYLKLTRKQFNKPGVPELIENSYGFIHYRFKYRWMELKIVIKEKIAEIKNKIMGAL